MIDASEPAWWRGCVVYQIYPRSFSDANGDGVGDLDGITAGLDHVAALGVDAVWISPFYRSPMDDFGYDVSDYCAVDPMFGDMAAFDRLLATAHAKGLRVILDQVPCHTSDRHPWFRESRQDRTNPKADWYIWADPKPDGTPPNNWLAHFGGVAWTWDPTRCQYYMHRFLPSQPALNWHNPKVREAVLTAMAFWLDKGVDGLRLDVVNMLFHDPALGDNPAKRADQRGDVHGQLANPFGYQDHVREDDWRPEVIETGIKSIRTLTDRYPGRTTIGEVGHERGLALCCDYTQGGDRLHQAYSFIFLGPRCSPDFLRTTIAQAESWVGDGWLMWSLSNHDTARAVTRWVSLAGSEALNRAMHDRFAKALLVFLSCLRGSICIYQGEELGLPEADLPFEAIVDPIGRTFWPEIKGRDGCRTPMPWHAAEPNAGFSEATPWLPVPGDHYDRAVDHQASDPESVLSFYRRFVPWRARNQTLRTGDLTLLTEGVPERMIALIRHGAAESLVCAVNFSQEASELTSAEPFAPSDAPGGDGTLSPDGRRLHLPPLGWHIVRIARSAA